VHGLTTRTGIAPGGHRPRPYGTTPHERPPLMP